jgi:hypothetical protein
MLEGGTDLLYRQALASGFEPLLEVQVWRENEQLEDDLIIMSGGVSATLTSRVSRTCTLTLHEDLYPVESDGLLNPYTDRLKIYSGIRFADGEEYRWQVFGGRITRVQMNSGQGTCTVEASDRAYEVLGAAFSKPENSTFGANVLTEFKRLVSDGVPDAFFGTSDSFFETMPRLTWEHDRSQALDEIATSCGAFWYPLADEQFVLRRYPWTVPGDPVITFYDDDDGTITTSTVTRDRTNIFNQITVTGERLDGTAPVYGTVSDLNPSSATYTLGPFGIQNKLIKLNTPAIQDTAIDAANAYLRRTTALTEFWSFTCVPDASLELGDVITINAMGRTNVRQVVASMNIPLGVSGDMGVTCRAQVIGELEGV